MTNAIPAVPAPSLCGMLLQILIAPGAAFQALRSRPTVLLPLLLLVICPLLLLYGYFHRADMDWLQEQLLLTIEDPVQREMARPFFNDVMIIQSSYTSTFLTCVFAFIGLGLYFHVLGKLLGLGLGLKHWFALVGWSSLPTLLATLSGTALLLSTPGSHLALAQLDPWSLNQLVFHQASGTWVNLLNSVDLTALWKWALLLTGFHMWSGRGWTASALLVLPPAVLYYGGWVLLNIAAG
ncbi:MAG: YIP1 family protein [Burkholderiaceae bacterium]|nr:YIP1 family protein [Burkholderiaceae bacterium]